MCTYVCMAPNIGGDMSSSACPYPWGMSLEFFVGFRVAKVPPISVAMFHGVIEPVSKGCAWKFWWHMWDDKASPILVPRKHF